VQERKGGGEGGRVGVKGQGERRGGGEQGGWVGRGGGKERGVGEKWRGRMEGDIEWDSGGYRYREGKKKRQCEGERRMMGKVGEGSGRGGGEEGIED